MTSSPTAAAATAESGLGSETAPTLEPTSRRVKAQNKIRETWREFCNKTTLHGWTYLGEKDKGSAHIVFWVATIVVGVIGSGLIVADTLEEFADDSVLTTIDSFTYPVERVPYPTVAVCAPLLPLRKSYDEWQFIRAAYNQLQFACSDEGSCRETELIRRKFAGFLDQVADFLLPRTPLPRDKTLVNCITEGIKGKIAKTGSKSEVMATTNQIVMERMTAKLDQDLFAYLNSAKDCGAITTEETADADVLQVAENAARAVAYPVRSGLGDIMAELASLNETLTAGHLRSVLGISSVGSVNNVCKELYAVYGYADNSTSARADGGPEQMADVAFCHRMMTERRPAYLGRVQKEIDSSFPTRCLDSFSNAETSTILCGRMSESGDEEENCPFFPVPTDWSVCHAFNAFSPSENFNSQLLADSIYSAYDVGAGSYRVVNNKADLIANRLSLVLDKSRWSYPGQDSFVVDVNAEHDYFDVSTNGNLLAKVGYETTVHVTPMQLVSSANLKTLKIAGRRCRYEAENPYPHSVFSQFTQKGCDFETKYRYARERHNCAPWFIPTSDSHSKEAVRRLCTQEESVAFQRTMAEFRRFHSNPDCVENCNEVDYEVIVTSNPVDPSEVCGGSGTDNKLLGLRAGSKWREYEEGQVSWRLGGNAIDRSFCERKVRDDLAFVSVEISRPRIMRLARRRRVTFADMLGNVGGTIGLFTGMSMLSVMELLYWSFKGITAAAKVIQSSISK